MPTSREVCPLYPALKDSFWKMTNEMSLGASNFFKSVDEEDHDVYESLFDDHDVYGNP